MLGSREAGKPGSPKIQLIELNMFIEEDRLKEKEVNYIARCI